VPASNNITGIVVLAAGASTRLGKPKQLVQYHGKTLLSHVVSEAVSSDAGPVIVVLGSNAGLVSKDLDKSRVQIVNNLEWEEGMASSVRTGLKTLLKVSPAAEAVILMVCDQPHVSASLINELIQTKNETGKPIVSCYYGDTMGPPALFHKSFFSELMQLKGDAGARKIIQQNSDQVATVLFIEGKIDIDTKADYEALDNS
jgi:molybdenum cofactor cytidylyltransferase